jgi:hypothetical protein
LILRAAATVAISTSTRNPDVLIFMTIILFSAENDINQPPDGAAKKNGGSPTPFATARNILPPGQVP